jgi:PII-like signaling protein
MGIAKTSQFAITWRARTLFASSRSKRLRSENVAGATVVHGVGASSVIHTAGPVELSANLPVVSTSVEDQPHVDRLLPILDEMIAASRAGCSRTRS